MRRLADVRVLDPACGSGNFLYLALQSLKDIERRAIVEAVEMGLALRVVHCGPQNVKGIEINQAEAELATDALCRAFDMMRAATRQLTDYAAERQAQGAARPTRFGELRERALFMACDHATRYVEHTAAAWQQAELRARAGRPTRQARRGQA